MGFLKSLFGADRAALSARSHLLEPISLGPTCASKFQLTRSLFLGSHPQGSVDKLREAIRNRRTSGIFPRHLFDSQITPLRALFTYLETDFTGVFEREDLYVGEGDLVTHRTLGSLHPHEFHPVDGRMHAAAIDAQYPSARTKFHHLAARFRAHLDAPGPFLYIRGENLSAEDAARLVALLSARGPHHRFQLLLAGSETGPDLTRIDCRIHQRFVPAQAGKPADIEWEGDDTGWERALRGFNIGLPNGPAYTTNFNILQDTQGLDLQPLTLDWRALPGFHPVAALPHTFTIGGDLWTYVALSGPVEMLASNRPRTLVVTLETLDGDVGLTLTRPDGSALVGREYWVRPEDGLLNLNLQLTPGMGPSNILLRRYAMAGPPGAVRVHAVRISA